MNWLNKDEVADTKLEYTADGQNSGLLIKMEDGMIITTTVLKGAATLEYEKGFLHEVCFKGYEEMGCVNPIYERTGTSYSIKEFNRLVDSR